MINQKVYDQSQYIPKSFNPKNQGSDNLPLKSELGFVGLVG
jgi:hypothetical protein